MGASSFCCDQWDTSGMKSIRPGSWMVFAGFALIALLIQSIGADAVAWLRYERAGVGAGEWWRLLSAGLAHTGWPHLALNMAALAFAAFAFDRLYSIGAWLAIFIASALGCTLCLLAFNPGVPWYLGASGALHGIFAAGTYRLSVGRFSAGYLFALLIVAKLAWEQWQGPLPGSADAAGVAVIVDAHLYGAIGGLVMAMLIQLCGKGTRRALSRSAARLRLGRSPRSQGHSRCPGLPPPAAR